MNPLLLLPLVAVAGYLLYRRRQASAELEGAPGVSRDDVANLLLQNGLVGVGVSTAVSGGGSGGSAIGLSSGNLAPQSTFGQGGFPSGDIHPVPTWGPGPTPSAAPQTSDYMPIGPTRFGVPGGPIGNPQPSIR